VSKLLSLDDEQTIALLNSIHKFCDIYWGPDRQRCGEFLSRDYWHSFRVLETALQFDPPETVERVESELATFIDTESLYQYLETAYVRLFISHRDGIAAPLYESCYVGVESGDKASLMGEPALKMRRRFESKGLSIDSNIHEPPDHLAIELEYLYFLLSKGREDPDGELIAEAGSFAVETMLPWVLKLQKQIAFQMPDHVYTLLTSILTRVLYRVGQFDPSQKSRAM
jgi:TorA-specific chaperone